jgi:hypothetical protein
VRLEVRTLDLSRRDDELLAKKRVFRNQFRPGPRQVLESTGPKLTGTGRLVEDVLDPGHHAGHLSADAEAEDGEHVGVLCSMSVSRSSLARIEKLSDPVADEVCSQVRYFEEGDQWVPRGSVLRCDLLTDAACEVDLEEPFVCIDGRDFTLAEFVKMVGTFGGWGMRIEFVPDDELHERPELEVREPEGE